MKVRELLKILQHVSPDADCVVAGFDHSYRGLSRPSMARAEVLGGGHYNEFHGADLVYDEKNAVIDVLVFE